MQYIGTKKSCHMDEKVRCGWCLKDDLYKKYHDEVWGEPVFDEKTLFAFLNLEGAQAGLSWYTILKKEEGYRKAFLNWDIKKIAKMGEKDILRLKGNPEIVRNTLKIKAVITNAQAYLKLKKTTTLSDYLWAYVDGQPIVNNWKSLDQIPAETPLSKEISKDLKKKGFKFVGPTIVYAYMQAVGMVNDHLITCWKRQA